MNLYKAHAHAALQLATLTSPLIVRSLVRATHGKAAERSNQLLQARRLTADLLARIDAAGAMAERVDVEEDVA